MTETRESLKIIVIISSSRQLQEGGDGIENHHRRPQKDRQEQTQKTTLHETKNILAGQSLTGRKENTQKTDINVSHARRGKERKENGKYKQEKNGNCVTGFDIK